MRVRSEEETKGGGTVGDEQSVFTLSVSVRTDTNPVSCGSCADLLCHSGSRRGSVANLSLIQNRTSNNDIRAEISTSIPNRNATPNVRV